MEQYDAALSRCREVFLKKTRDYGTAWRILRPSSLTDQIFIKASRIRSIEQKGEQRVADPVESEYLGIVNYSVLALLQLQLPADEQLELPYEKVRDLYDQEVHSTRELMMGKNHDYGEAWRDMRLSSMTDMILMKLLRIRQIESNDGKTLISEGIDANYRDIMNYALFAMILLAEDRRRKTQDI